MAYVYSHTHTHITSNNVVRMDLEGGGYIINLVSRPTHGGLGCKLGLCIRRVRAMCKGQYKKATVRIPRTLSGQNDKESSKKQHPLTHTHTHRRDGVNVM